MRHRRGGDRFTGFISGLSQRWAAISKTQMKNAKKAFNHEKMKSDAKDRKEVRSPVRPGLGRREGGSVTAAIIPLVY